MDTYNSRILVVSDSNEILRQPHADSREFFETIEASLRARGMQCTFDFATESETATQVDRQAIDQYAAIVFASNALIRPDSHLATLLRSRRSVLEEFSSNGGGVVVLHQGFSGDHADVDWIPGFAGTTIRSNSSAQRPAGELHLAEHHVFQFPNLVTAHDITACSERSGFPVSYTSVSRHAMGTTHPLLTLDGDGLIVVSDLYPQTMACTMPVDWHRNAALVENLVHYALLGQPRITAMVDGEQLRNLDRALSSLGTDLPITWISEPRTPEEESQVKFLLEHSDINIFQTPLTDTADALLRSRESVSNLVIKLEGSESGSPTESVEIDFRRSDFSDYEAAMRAELSQLIATDWFRSALIIDIRDLVVSALECGLDSVEHLVRHEARPQIVERCEAWLATNRWDSDPMTALIALWLRAAVGGTPTPATQVADLRTKLDGGGQRLLAAVCGAPGPLPKRGSSRQPADASAPAEPEASTTRESLGSLVRRLENYRMSAVLTPAGDRPAPAVEDPTALLASVDDVLIRDSEEGLLDWSSPDSTAVLAAGTARLLGAPGAVGRTPPPAVRAFLSQATNVLFNSFRASAAERSQAHDPRLNVMVAGALCAMERTDPVSGRATLLRVIGGASQASTDSLYAEIARQHSEIQRLNERQRDQRAELETCRNRLKDQRERGPEHMRASALFGRWSWVLLTLICLGSAIYFGTVLAVALAPGGEQRLDAIGAATVPFAMVSGVIVVGWKYHLYPWMSWGPKHEIEVEQ